VFLLTSGNLIDDDLVEDVMAGLWAARNQEVEMWNRGGAAPGVAF
jgi:hypothetical protein